MDENANLPKVIWGRVKYKWKNPQEHTYILLQEKITVHADGPSESEWVSVGFDAEERKGCDS
jgi:hypothetical protein